MDPEDIKKYLKDLEFKSRTKEPKKLAAEIAFHCVRNNTIIEDIHAGKEMPDKYYANEPLYSRITQREMMIFMMEVTKNIEMALANTDGFFTTLTESPFGQVPSYWESAPISPMLSSHEETSKWQDKILAMSDEEWHEFCMNQK